MKGSTLSDVMARLPAARQKRIRQRGEELATEYRLAQVREAAMKKQSEIEGMTQDAVSRLENRKDWLVSSLNTYVRGMGGTLKIVAEFPGLGTVELPITSRGRIAKKNQAEAARPQRRRSAAA